MQKTLEQLKSELDKVSNYRKTLSKQLDDSYEVFEKLNLEYYKLKYDFEPSLEAICAIEDWDKIPYQVYQKFTRYLEVKHSYVYVNGFHPDTNQIGFCLTEYNNPGTDYSKIEHLLTLIRPDSQNNRVISILDSSCGEHGAWNLINGTKVERTTYHCVDITKEFPTAGEALNWIYSNLFTKTDEDD